MTEDFNTKLEDLRKSAGDFLDNRAAPEPDFGAPKGLDEQINGMPNWEKITPFERGVYKFLPGFSQSSFGKALGAFSETWAGKALSYLDIPAEGLERTFGLAIQLANGGFDPKDLKAAWYAGSMTAETAQLPGLKYGPDGKIVGVTMHDELPDVAGLINARNKIQSLMEQGKTATEALTQVREEYYKGLGALALRAQLQDAMVHTVLDPINIIMPILKPVERLKAMAVIASTSKIAYSEEELLSTAGKLTAKAEELAKLGDRAADVESLTNEARLLVESAGKINRGELPRITQWDRFAMFATGGDPFRPSKLSQAVAKVPILNLTQLTPESKAKMMLSMLSDNLGTTLIQRVMFEADGEEQFVRALERTAMGSTGIEYGHAVMSLEGRTVQGFLHGVSPKVRELFVNYMSIKEERDLLSLVSRTLGENDLEKIIKLAGSDPDSLLRMLEARGANAPEILAQIQDGTMNTQRLETLAKLKDAMYNREHFFVTAMDAIETHAMRQAITQFGVEARGPMTRWSNALKAGESLAFLRLNPAYPIRNWVNNEMTMIGRGLFGVMTGQEQEDLMRGIAWVPSRLKESFTTELGGLAEGGTAHYAAMQELEKALRGGNFGAPEKVQNFFRQINLGNLDAAKFGRYLEQSASRRATLFGLRQFFDRYWKPQSIASYMDRSLAEAVGQTNPDFIREFDNAVRGSHAVTEQLDQLAKVNLNLNVNSVLDEATRSAGFDVREMLGDEVLGVLHDGLPKALQEGKVPEFVAGLRRKIDTHIEDLFQAKLGDVVEHVKAQVQAGGPLAYPKYMGEAQDIFWSAHSEHAFRMDDVTKAAREAGASGDWTAAGLRWDQVAQDDAKFFDRAFRRVDAYLQGMEDAGKQGIEINGKLTKFPFPKEVRSSFGEWKKMWADFFEFRNTERKAFFDAYRAGETPRLSWDDLAAELDTRYKQAAAHEDELMRRIDDKVGEMITDPQRRLAFQNARDVMGELRKANKDNLMEVMRQVREAPADQRQGLWNKFWSERMHEYQQMKDVDRASRNVLQGDPSAMRLFETPAPREPVQTNVPLTPEQQKAISMGIPEGEARAASNPPDSSMFDPNLPYFDEAGNLVEPGAKATDALGVATELGIPTASPSGARTEKRLLNIINKYIEGQGKEVATGTAAELGATKGSPQSIIARAGGLKWKDAVDVFGERPGRGKGFIPGLVRAKPKDLGMASRNLASDAGLSLDDIGRVLVENGVMTPADAEDLNKVREVIRTNRAVGGFAAERMPRVDTLAEANQYPETVRKALEDWASRNPGKLIQKSAASPATAAPAATQISPQYLANFEEVIPDPVPLELGVDLMSYGRSYGALDHIVTGAERQAKKVPMMLANLPEDQQAAVLRAINQLKGDMSTARYSATRFAEWRRDSALLNYNRRTNFDAMLGNFFPYVFWTTGSIQKWAIESIDRPAMLTTYLRMKKFLATSGLHQEGQPSRVQGNIRIPLPFRPDWMGDAFVDPLRLALPFDAMLSPIDQMHKAQMGVDGQTERLLRTKLNDGSISQSDYDKALAEHAGGVWEEAKAETVRNGEGDKFDAWDFATSLSSPHAPIMWAYNAATGHPEDIAPFAPASRIMRNAATLLGVPDYLNSPWNVEGKIRRSLGLPAFDKWDGYRVDRALSDMAGSGEYSIDDIKQAMYLSALVQEGKMTPEAAKQQNPVYAKGIERSNQEYTGGAASFGLSVLGLSVKSVPEGEVNLRRLTDDMGRAFEARDKAEQNLNAYMASHTGMPPDEAMKRWEALNPKLAKDANAVTKFFDDHPEYESRLAIWKKPEERMQQFLIDQLWKTYNTYPDLNKREIRDQLGPEFQQVFLDRETRSYERITPELASVWLKLMNGKVPGMLTATESALLSLNALKLTKPEAAWRVQSFYDFRNQSFGNYYELQNGYFALSSTADKRKYMQAHPELGQYWDWRRDWLMKNPDLAAYLEDDPKKLERYQKQGRRGPGSVPTTIELPPIVSELMTSYAGQVFPPALEQELRFIASQNGLSYEQLLGMYGH